MADQFNLADELRRGGTGLLAQAVADLRHSFRDLYQGQPLPDVLWLQAMTERAAAVPAGNQAKAPTALDEMRALPGATGALERIDWETEYNRMAQAECESREALARVEAEREEAMRKLTTMTWLLWDVRTKSRSELEEANWGGRADEWLDVVLHNKTLSALDQAASAAEVTERGAMRDLADPLCRCGHRRSTHSKERCFQEFCADPCPCECFEAEVTEPEIRRVCERCRGDGYMHCACGDAEDFSDPEATESATKETK